MTAISVDTSIPCKAPAEIITYEFDFSGVATVVSNPVVTIAYFSGTDDASPSSMLGAAQAAGTKVLQRISGGQIGTTYKLSCQVDDADGERFILPGYIAVEAV